MPSSESCDLVVVGAGIVGLATARAWQQVRPDDRVIVVDKEATVAAHQSGHNSGVIHAGVYYPPGSRKAALCAAGRRELEDFCDRHGITWERCGKVIVATDDDEATRLGDLAERARANGIEVHRLDRRGLADHEPHAAGVAALHVPSTAIVDFRQVCAALAADVEAGGGTILLGHRVQRIETVGDEVVVSLATTASGNEGEPGAEVRAHRVANCAGLRSGPGGTGGRRRADGARILPFRGEYAELVADRRHLVRNLIYPVPDPRFPFLGTHFTRMVDGSVHAGPNAVLALSREGYRWRDVNLVDVAAMAGDRATWRLAPSLLAHRAG